MREQSILEPSESTDVTQISEIVETKLDVVMPNGHAIVDDSPAVSPPMLPGAVGAAIAQDPRLRMVGPDAPPLEATDWQKITFRARHWLRSKMFDLLFADYYLEEQHYRRELFAYLEGVVSYVDAQTEQTRQGVEQRSEGVIDRVDEVQARLAKAADSIGKSIIDLGSSLNSVEKKFKKKTDELQYDEERIMKLLMRAQTDILDINDYLKSSGNGSSTR